MNHQNPSPSTCASSTSSTTLNQSCNPSNGPSEFVKKLYQMLEDSNSTNIVSWSTSKDSLIVKDQNLFQTKILPQHFKHSNFASFVRQLNKYEFKKVKIDHNDSHQNENSLIWEFHHPYFRADTLANLDHIKRKAPCSKRSSTKVLSSSLPATTTTTTPFQSIHHHSIDQLQLDLKNLMDLHHQTELLVKELIQSNTDLTQQLTKCHQLISDQDLRLQSLENQRDVKKSTTFQNENHDFEVLESPTTVLQTTQSHPLLPTCEENQRNPLQLDPRSLIQTSSLLFSSASSPLPSNNPICRLPPPLIQEAKKWLSPPTVLLVEDDQIYRSLSGRFLEFIGCKMVTCNDGIEAVQVMAQQHFDLVFMDIYMPFMDGILATSLIRQFDVFTPIISMTSNFDPMEISKYLGIGMNDCLPKPFTKEKMLMMLEKHLVHHLVDEKVQLASNKRSFNEFNERFSVFDYKDEQRDHQLSKRSKIL
ncbi:HSF-type DNA-binding-domain-containing protein [Melampsora americana]|nr:HSF-type DNA-binding-domain-containing protein [Melampsora americana]